MILKITNLVILAFILTNAFWLINKRFETRIDYTDLADLQKNAETMNKEYTRLQIEEGTFSSDLILQNLAKNKLGLIEPDDKHTRMIDDSIVKNINAEKDNGMTAKKILDGKDN